LPTSDGWTESVYTWDAAPGRTWTGTVEKRATQVVALGTRQVGEVECVIENPDRDLLPGTNVNVEIRSKQVENALTIPKEAIRREGGRTGVFALGGEDQIFWRDIQLGTMSVTRAQVTGGLKEGDGVVVSSTVPLKNGMHITPTWP
jgi:multidrug efflux pump subunit AcrA (membrane-fusion protein)